MKNYLDKLKELHQYSESYVDILHELKYGEGIYNENGDYKNEELLRTIRARLKILCEEVGISYYRVQDNLENVIL